MLDSTAANASPGDSPPPRTWPVYAVTAMLFAGMILLPGVVLPGGEDGAFRELYGTLPGFLWTAGLSVAWIGMVTFVVAVISPAPPGARLGLTPARLTRPGWAIAVLGALALSQAIDLALQLAGIGRGAPLQLMLDVLSRARGTELVAALLIVGVGAGTVEELFFRGYAQRRLVARHGAPVGIVIAATLFALAHGDPRHAAFAFCFGAFAGAIAHWSDSTGPAIALHVVNNAVSVLAVAGGLDALERSASRAALAVACALLLVVAIASARTVRRQAAQWTATRALG